MKEIYIKMDNYVNTFSDYIHNYISKFKLKIIKITIPKRYYLELSNHLSMGQTRRPGYNIIQFYTHNGCVDIAEGK